MQPAIESFAGIGQEVELYPELFPELEVRTVQRPPPRQTRVIAPRFSPVSLAPVATSPACFLRRGYRDPGFLPAQQFYFTALSHPTDA